MTSTVKINYDLIKLMLCEKKFTTKDVEPSKQLMRKWNMAGVLTGSQDRSWSRFSPFDLLWINLIEEMRSFGLGLNQVAVARKHLFAPTNQDTDSLLLRSFIEIIITQLPIYLVVDNEGNAELVNDELFIDKLKSPDFTSHLVILLNAIIKRNLPRLWETPEFSGLSELSKKELELLRIVRDKRFKTIRIKKKDGSIDMIEGMESVDTEKRIIDLLKEGKYQNIELKQENGKVVIVTRTVKKKL